MWVHFRTLPSASLVDVSIRSPISHSFYYSCPISGLAIRYCVSSHFILSKQCFGHSRLSLYTDFRISLLKSAKNSDGLLVALNCIEYMNQFGENWHPFLKYILFIMLL